MKSVLVNARVPLAKKEAAGAVLKKIGSNTSELINSAYDYLLRFGKLPDTAEEARPAAASFKDFVSESTLDIDWGPHPEAVDYKAILREGKAADYESLA